MRRDAGTAIPLWCRPIAKRPCCSNSAAVCGPGRHRCRRPSANRSTWASHPSRASPDILRLAILHWPGRRLAIRRSRCCSICCGAYTNSCPLVRVHGNRSCGQWPFGTSRCGGTSTSRRRVTPGVRTFTLSDVLLELSSGCPCGTCGELGHNKAASWGRQSREKQLRFRGLQLEFCDEKRNLPKLSRRTPDAAGCCRHHGGSRRTLGLLRPQCRCDCR